MLARIKGDIWGRLVRPGIVLAALLWAPLLASGQSCPSESEDGSEAHDVSTLHGTLVYHDELRQWLGLKLDQPACGEAEIQLVVSDDAAGRRAKTLRGCAITITGRLYLAPTGYYSAELAVFDGVLQPDSSCHPYPLEPDPSLAPIPPNVHSYHVSITVDYRGKGHKDVAVWQGGNKHVLLKPWQAYAGYFLTGDAVMLRVYCAKSFQLTGVLQDPRVERGIFTDDISTAVLLTGSGINTVAFTCRK
ncbi:MAG TPA: hypothetical protein VMT28_06605 [Terriglobales bacterium]|nr:hypothetical protein [Terriglobales bacterium]